MSSSDSPHRRRLVLLATILLITLACVNPLGPAPTPIVITATFPPATETPTPAATDIVLETSPVPSEAPSQAAGGSCTVLQDVNLRKGPGTAYNPPITALLKDTTFTPLAFNPQGFPGGTWVQARVDSLNQTGWVSAGAQYVSCDIDLATLQPVAVAPPPKPAPPKIGTGDVDGDGISNFRSSFDYNPEYFVRMYVFRSDDENEQFSPDKDGRGIQSVHFRVTSADGGTTYYESTENNAGYCIFGGGEPDCNPWTYDNYRYYWGQGGEVVVPGNYQMTVTATGEDGVEGTWFIQIHVNP